MTKLNREIIDRYRCCDCKFYLDKWTCSLEECFFVTEAAQAERMRRRVQPAVKWEVIV